MTDTLAEKRARFRALHEKGCFLLPNPWDIGSATRLEKLGFQAMATSSAATAWSLGKQDYEITLEDALANMALVAGATGLPVNADFEAGFAETPEGVAANVTRAISTGIAGFSIEDRAGIGLRDETLGVECVAAARTAIDASGGNVLLVARTEAYLVGQPDPASAIARLRAYAAAGADCLYAPGVTDMGVIADMVAAVAPKPLNVLIMNEAMRPGELAQIGVRRISVGGAFAWAAWNAFDAAAADFRASLSDG